MVTTKRLHEKLTKENLWIFIMHLLHTEGPLPGVLIKKRLEEKYGVKFGNVLHYKVLYNLERKGLVRKFKHKLGKVYHVTDGGLKHLSDGIQMMEHYLGLLKQGFNDPIPEPELNE